MFYQHNFYIPSESQMPNLSPTPKIPSGAFGEEQTISGLTLNTKSCHWFIKNSNIIVL